MTYTAGIRNHIRLDSELARHGWTTKGSAEQVSQRISEIMQQMDVSDPDSVIEITITVEKGV